MPRGEISSADLLIAIKELPWEAQGHLNLIARSLGFSNLSQNEDMSENRNSIYNRNHPTNSIEKNQDTLINTRKQTPPSALTPSETSVDLPSQILPHRLTILDSLVESREPPDWLGETYSDLLKDLDPLEREKEFPKLARKSIFPANVSRGILSASLRVQRMGTEPDIQKIIEQITRNKIGRDLPNLIRSSVTRGCQLLLDYSDNMTPYWDDLNDLAVQVKNVVGTECLNIYEFEANPLEATSCKTNQVWQAEKACPILIASHFGLSVQSRYSIISEGWKEFISKCQLAGSPLIILIPIQRKRWPTGMGSYPILIHWNPHVTATMIWQLIGKGHKVEL